MNEVELLFTEILNCNRLSLYLNKDLHLDKNKSILFASALKRRLKGEPIEYILGKTEFMGLEFRVTPDVFIPRPETEILVEIAIKIGRKLLVASDRLNILDIGTGCGNIAISIAKFLPQCRVSAIDISGPALKIARLNAELNDVKIDFIQSNLFTICYLQPVTYELIVSNPPYIASYEIARLQPEIQYEPKIALDGGKDGLDFYRRIVDTSQFFLRDNGYLIMEIGFNQKKAVENIFKKSKNFEIIDIVKDYNNIDRVIVAKLNSK